MSTLKTKPQFSRFCKAERGMTMLEVIVSMLVIGLGLAITVSMMVASNRYANSAEYRSIAMQEMQSIIDAMRNNQLGASAYVSGVATKTNQCSAASSSCKLREKLKENAVNDAQDRAVQEKSIWQAGLAVSLPQGDGNIISLDPVTGTYQVTVQWRVSGEPDTNGASISNGRTDALRIAFTL